MHAYVRVCVHVCACVHARTQVCMRDCVRAWVCAHPDRCPDFNEDTAAYNSLSMLICQVMRSAHLFDVAVPS